MQRYAVAREASRIDGVICDSITVWNHGAVAVISIILIINGAHTLNIECFDIVISKLMCTDVMLQKTW